MTHYLVIDNCFGIIEHKIPVIAVDEAKERHRSHCDFGFERRELGKGNVVVPIHVKWRHGAIIWLFCIVAQAL